MGTWTYVYDPVGQMVRQVDAKTQEIVTGYDKLGRMTSRVSVDLSSSWTYDTATYGLGKVASMATTAGFAKSLTYDSLSRPSQSSTTIDGQVYTSTSTYDANGRLATVVYPSSSRCATSTPLWATRSKPATTAPTRCSGGPIR
jgi:YD repeat-containing protein